MNRPDTHVTDTLGQTQFRATLEGLGWTVNPVANDYGSDFEVEVFQAGRSTGVSFKVQLKSSRAPDYSADGDYVSVQISRESAAYMCRELHVPVILVHADIAQKKTFWTVAQLDNRALRSLARLPEQGGVTFRIPTKNHLPDTWAYLLQAVGQAETLLSLRSLLNEPFPSFLNSIEGRVDKDKVRVDLKNKSDAIRVQQAHELLKAGSIDGARARLSRVLVDNEASVEIRFWALLTSEDIETAEVSKRGATPEEQSSVRLSIALQLRALTDDGPPHLKFYAVLLKRACELLALSSRDWAQHLNWKLNETGGDPFWRAELAFERARLTRQIVRKYYECARLARYASTSEHLWALPQALTRIALGLTMFIQRLRGEGLATQAAAYRDSALSICRLAAQVARFFGDDETLSNAAGAAGGLAEGTSSEAYKWAHQTFDLLSNKELKDELIARLETFGQLLDTSASEYQISIEEEQRTYTSMATALGVDLSATDDLIADAVRVGIADFDPTRVLRNCQHLFVSLGSHGVVGDWLRLPTIGTKFLHCTLHGHMVGGASLDSVYADFRHDYCNSCADCEPHEADWHYSHAWQRAQNETHEKYIKLGNQA
jgi:hypothetical protein